MFMPSSSLLPGRSVEEGGIDQVRCALCLSNQRGREGVRRVRIRPSLGPGVEILSRVRRQPGEQLEPRWQQMASGLLLAPAGRISASLDRHEAYEAPRPRAERSNERGPEL